MASLHRLLAAALVAAGSFAPAQAAPWRVSIDTTPLAGTSGFVAFDFFAGSAASGNVVRIGNLVFDGVLGLPSTTGDVAGTLSAGTLTLGGGGSLFSEWLQGLSFGGTLAFDLELGNTAAAAGERPDQFSLFLLDDALLPRATDDPALADALLAIDLMGSATAPQVYRSEFATLRIEPIVSNGVPLPGTAPLLALGVLAVAAGRWRRAPAAASAA